MTTVPHLPSADDLAALQAHYAPYGGFITQNDSGFIVRLPRQQRIHFYPLYTNLCKTTREEWHWRGPTYPFKSEGYYDQHSPYWLAA